MKGMAYNYQVDDPDRSNSFAIAGILMISAAVIAFYSINAIYKSSATRAPAEEIRDTIEERDAQEKAWYSRSSD